MTSKTYFWQPEADGQESQVLSLELHVKSRSTRYITIHQKNHFFCLTTRQIGSVSFLWMGPPAELLPPPFSLPVGLIAAPEHHCNNAPPKIAPLPHSSHHPPLWHTTKWSVLPKACNIMPTSLSVELGREKRYFITEEGQTKSTVPREGSGTGASKINDTEWGWWTLVREEEEEEEMQCRNEGSKVKVFWVAS